MEKIKKLEIIKSINYDVEMGYFDQFPKTKNRLLYIAEKLLKSTFVINPEYELSANEIKTLELNDYL